MTNRTFYKTRIVYEVLHEEPIPDDTSLADIIHEADEGGYCGSTVSWETEQINGKQAADALLEHASDPEFFMLDKEGNDLP